MERVLIRNGRRLNPQGGARRQLWNARSAWRKMTSEQRIEFLAWVLDRCTPLPDDAAMLRGRESMLLKTAQGLVRNDSAEVPSLDAQQAS